MSAVYNSDIDGTAPSSDAPCWVAVSKKVHAFDLDVLVYDPYVDADEVGAHDAEKVDFDELLDHSDFVSVHAPLTGETEGMFDADAFSRMQEEEILVNTARGSMVDTDDLYDALVAGDIGGAGIDVMPTEPPGDRSLFELDDVVATPYVSWYSEESYEELRCTVTSDVLGVLWGKEPRNPVNEVDGG